MIEMQIAVLALGLSLSCSKKIGLANPFQVYFGTWLFVLFWFYLTADSYPNLVSEFKLLTLSGVVLSFLMFICIKKYYPFDIRVSKNIKIESRAALLEFLQIVVILSVPFAYQNAVMLAGGMDIFTKEGYWALRWALLAQKSHSLYAYLCTLSMVLTSIQIYQLKSSDHWARKLLTVFSFMATMVYLMLSTGRTFSLLFLCLLFVPWILTGRLKLKGVLIAAILLLGLFAAVTILLGKIQSVPELAISKVYGIYEHLKLYIVAPFASFGDLFKHGSPVLLGEYTFRFFIKIFHDLHLTELVPVPMVRDHPPMDGLVNVFTVYEVYFLDFGYLGFILPTALLFVNWWLYVRAKLRAGPWLFIYAASFYPLMMQFFNDQYMTLLSMWIQIAFFCFLFIKLEPVSNEAQAR